MDALSTYQVCVRGHVCVVTVVRLYKLGQWVKHNYLQDISCDCYFCCYT